MLDYHRAGFRTPCPQCGRMIEKGDAITKRLGFWQHPACSSPKVAAEKPAPSPWQPYLGQTVTVRRGRHEVTGKLFREHRYSDRDGSPLPDRWWLSQTFSGYAGSSYRRAFDLCDGDVFMRAEER